MKGGSTSSDGSRRSTRALSVQRTLSLRHSTLCGRGSMTKRTTLALSIVVSAFVILVACSGNTKRTSTFNQLQLEFDDCSALLSPLDSFAVSARLTNLSAEPVSICTTRKTTLITKSDGSIIPIGGGPWTDGCGAISIDSHSSYDLEFHGLLLPSWVEGSTTLHARLRFVIELGQFFRPGKLYTLTATCPLRVAERPAGSGLPHNQALHWTIPRASLAPLPVSLGRYAGLGPRKKIIIQNPYLLRACIARIRLIANAWKNRM